MSHIIHKGVIGIHEGDPLHLYANASTGDDRNSGLASDDAKATLDGLWNVTPKALGKCTNYIGLVLHLSGTFTSQSLNLGIDNRYSGILVDGGANRVKKSGTNDSYTSTSTSTSSIIDNTQTWTVDEYAGWWVEILNGANGTTGDVRTIQKNDATGLYPTQNFSADPEAGATFRICQPETTFSGSDISIAGPDTIGSGSSIKIQRLYFDGASYFPYGFARSRVNASQIITNSSSSSGVSVWSMALLALNNKHTDPTTLVETTGGVPGFSQLGTGGAYLSSIDYFELGASYIKWLRLSGARWFRIFMGTRCVKTYVRSVFDSRLNDPLLSSALNIYSQSGYANVLFSNPDGNGMDLIGSYIRMGDLVEFSNNGGHGINCERSYIYFNNATSGSGNTGAGLYAHDGSIVNVKDGITPTLTGTVGDISTDGTTEAISWSAVDDGSVYSNANEQTLIKEVA